MAGCISWMHRISSDPIRGFGHQKTREPLPMWQAPIRKECDFVMQSPRSQFWVLCFSRFIPLHWAAWFLNTLSLTTSMVMRASCMFPLHQGTLQQHWMVYSHIWPRSSHGCRPINWNWTQIQLNSSLLGTDDSGANTSLCFQWASRCQN